MHSHLELGALSGKGRLGTAPFRAKNVVQNHWPGGERWWASHVKKWRRNSHGRQTKSRHDVYCASFPPPSPRADLRSLPGRSGAAAHSSTSSMRSQPIGSCSYPEQTPRRGWEHKTQPRHTQGITRCHRSVAGRIRKQISLSKSSHRTQHFWVYPCGRSDILIARATLSRCSAALLRITLYSTPRVL
jgi:hypothetical protein